MKKILLFLAIFIQFNSFGQGELQFNQVITQVGTTTNAPIYTVPAGKVWKVESISSSYPNYLNVNINNVSVDLMYSSGFMPFPFWLKATDVIQIFSASYPINYVISIVEFNIVP